MERCVVKKLTMQDIANAIRVKNELTDTYLPNLMSAAILDIDTTKPPILNYYINNSGKDPINLIGENEEVIIADVLAYKKIDGSWTLIGIDLLNTLIENHTLELQEYKLPNGYLELPLLITVSNETTYTYQETTSYTNPNESKFGQGYVDSTTTTRSSTYRNCVMKITFKGYETFPVAIHNYGAQTTSTYSLVFLSNLNDSTYPTTATGALKTVTKTTVTSPNESTYTVHTFENLNSETEYTVYINHRYRAQRNNTSVSTYSVIWLPIIGTYITKTS